MTKHLLRTILLLGVLCLAGCKEDDQSVSFSIKEYKTSVIGEILTVNVTANCSWTLSENSQQIVIEEMAGEGDVSIRVNIARNFNYDELTHVITITSEDRTSSDVLTIVQDKNVGTEVGEFGMISEEGGTFEIPVKTNDDIASVNTPDWMTFTSSRGLTGYSYIFTVEPNKTGSVRSGVVKLNGKENVARLEVTQDSYAPTRIRFNKKISVFSEKSFTTLFSVEPKYADLSKLEISSPEGCDAYIDNGFFKFYFSRQGLYPITFLSKGEIIQEEFTGYLQDGLFGKNAQSIFYLGQQTRLSTVIQDDNFTYSSTNPGVVNIADDGTMDMKSIGTSTIVVTLPGTGFSALQEVSVQDAVLTSYMRSCLNWGYWWDVEIASILDGNGITKYAFCTCDRNQAIVFPQAAVEGEYKDGRNRMSYLARINVYADNLSDLKERLKKIEVEFGGIVNGKQTIVTTRVLPEKPKWLK